VRKHKSQREESNLRPMVYETIALPLSYAGGTIRDYITRVFAFRTGFPSISHRSSKNHELTRKRSEYSGHYTHIV
jgi:hypothetical protein